MDQSPRFPETSIIGIDGQAVWYQKWWVHLRHHPESGGAIVHFIKTNQLGTIEGQVSNTVLITLSSCLA
jgi:hypothetical protein